MVVSPRHRDSFIDHNLETTLKVTLKPESAKNAYIIMQNQEIRNASDATDTQDDKHPEPANVAAPKIKLVPNLEQKKEIRTLLWKVPKASE